MKNASVARRVAWWSLLATVVLVPLVMSGFSLPGVQGGLDFSSVELVKLSFLTFLVLIAFTCWAADLLRNGGRIRHSPVDWVILAWLVWVGVCTLTSIHWPTALLGAQGRYEGLVTSFLYALIYFLAMQFVGEQDRTQRLAQALFCSSIIIAAYGLLQYTGVVLVPDKVPWIDTGRAFSTYGQPNVLGGFLIFASGVSLALALREKRKLLRLTYWAGLGLNLLSLVVTFSRGAWLGAAVTLVLLVAIAWRQRARLHRVDFIPAGVFGAALIGLIARSLSKPGAISIAKRISSIFDWGEGTAAIRTEIWKAAAGTIKDSPFFGWGPDTFGLTYPRFQTAEYVYREGATSVAYNAHNYPLHLAAGVGIFGALLLVAFWVWAFSRSGKTVFGRGGGGSRILLGAFWASSLGYFVHLVFNISVPGTTFLLWIALAVILAPTARTLQVPARRFGTTAAVVIALVSILGIAGQSVALAADRSYVIARDEFSQQPLSVRITAADRAVHLNPLVPQYRTTAATVRGELARVDATALAQAESETEETTRQTETLATSFASAESAYLEAIDFCPHDYSNYVNLAALYNLAGANLDSKYYQLSIETAELGIEVMPLGTDIRERLAEALDSVGRSDEALETLEYCMQIYPVEYSAALTLAALYQEQDRADEALTMLRSVRELSDDRYTERNYMLDSAIASLEEGSPLR